jgi:hypothetical protein
VLPGLTGHLISHGVLAALAPWPEHRISVERSRRELLEWRQFRTPLGPASATRVVLESAATPLLCALGYDFLDVAEAAGALVATLRAHEHTVTLLVTQWREGLDRFWRIAVTEAGRRTSTWCIMFNGTNIRVVDARRLYSRRYLDFDIDLAIDDPHSFLALWRTLSAVALTKPDGDAGSLAALVLESELHAAAVCRDLREGVLKASADVLQALISDRSMAGSSVADSFEQTLTIVYRILFLLFAEARALVPLWHPIYRESYSIESLRTAAERSPRKAGCWDALRAIARLAHSGCRAGDLRVTPFNGRLFSPARTPLAERRDLDDAAAGRAVLALSTRPAADRAGRERIAYRDLGVEQLGAVYETLLDYQPRVTGRRPATISLERGSGMRKSTGSFYTPQPIVEYLVRRTLGPLVHDASADEILRLRIVDPSMGSGAFLVAACQYLAAAYERALVAAGSCLASDISEQDRIAIRRSVAERCLYGVDLNPMAVQLARLSLWLATLAADCPLTFLDHHLTTGDSLLGAWLTDLRRRPERRPARRTSPLPLFPDQSLAKAIGRALPVRFSLEAAPARTLAEIRSKERALASLTRPDAALSRWRRIGNIWCATWFPEADRVPAVAFKALTDAVLAGSSALPDAATKKLLDATEAAAQRRRFFHWELEFPEVFFDEGGGQLARPGFDAVLGNPPWDMLRADGHPGEPRSRAREDAGAVVRFTRDAGVYHWQSSGQANRYQLFVERSIALTRSGGRIGLVLPSGLATDHGSRMLRRLLLERCDVDAIVGIDNRRTIFPIHRGVRFLLVTAACGSPTRQIACRLGLEDAGELEDAGDGPIETRSFFQVHLSPAMLERLSGPELVIPNVKNMMDLAIAEKAAALFPALASEQGWAAKFGRELNATDDRGVFVPAGCGLPVVDGRHLEPFRVALERSSRSIERADAHRRLGSHRFDRPRLAYRDVASATNRLTLIAAILPAGCVSTHTVFCLRTPLPSRAQHFLCGLFNSYVVNYLVRLRVTTHVMTSLVERLPLPTADAAPASFRQVSALGRLLSRRSNLTALAMLNARVAQLYQLTRDEFAHVLSTFPLLAAGEREAALGNL